MTLGHKYSKIGGMTEKSISITRTIIAYIIWMVVTAALFLLLLSGRGALMAVLGRFSMGSFGQRMRAGLLDKVYLIVGGIAVLGISIILERYLPGSTLWLTLWIRSLRTFGFELVALSVFSAVLQLSQGVFSADIGFTLTYLAPAVGGISLIVLSYFLKRKQASKPAARPVGFSGKETTGT